MAAGPRPAARASPGTSVAPPPAEALRTGPREPGRDTPDGSWSTMSRSTTEFLDRVQDAASIPDRQEAVRGVRAVFRALMSRHGDQRVRELAALLPEELETLWKPAFYASLREPTLGSGSDGGRAMGREVAGEVPGLDEGDGERLARAVVVALEPFLTADRRAELKPYLPAALRGS